MIIFIYGTDTDKIRETSRKHLDTLKSKRPDAGFFKMDDETFDEAKFEELIFSQGLFDKKFIVHLDRALSNKEAREFIIKHLSELTESENAFVITENKLAKPTFEKIKKEAFKTEVFEASRTAVAEKPEFNIFSLADALGRKDKKQMWVLLYKALRAGTTPEQIHGTLFAQVKNMAFIKRAETPASAKSSGEAMEKVKTSDLGLHPFVVKKATGFVKNFSQDELEELSRKLVTIYHDARRGGDELPVALEKFVLKI